MWSKSKDFFQMIRTSVLTNLNVVVFKHWLTLLLVASQFIDLKSSSDVWRILSSLTQNGLSSLTQNRMYFFCLICAFFFVFFSKIRVLALLTFFRLARIQDMLLPNAVLHLYPYIQCLIGGYSLLSVYSLKEYILSDSRQNEYSVCYQETSHKGFQSLYWVFFRFARRPYAGIGYINHLHIKVELTSLLAALSLT